MSRKRPKKHASRKVSTLSGETPETLDAAPDDAVVVDEVLAEGSGPLEAALDVSELAAVAEELASIETSSIETSGHLSREVGAPDVSDEELEAAGDAIMQDLTDREFDDGIRVAELSAKSDDELTDEALDAQLDAAGTALEVADGMELSADAPLDEDGNPIELDDGDGAMLPTSAATMDNVQLKQLLEALVFAADKPITVQRLRQLTRIADMKRIEDALVEIQADYEPRGLLLTSVSGGWQFRTRPQFSAWVQQLIAGRPVRLSRAQLETLAIIAYRQPITRPEIDDIRGVDSSATLKLLLDRALIRVLGKKEEVGRPMLYGTTKEFLDFFSLTDLRELPTLREYSELSDESRQVISKRLGVSLDDITGSGSGGATEGSASGADGGDPGPTDGGNGGNLGDDESSERSASGYSSIDDMLQAYGESDGVAGADLVASAEASEEPFEPNDGSAEALDEVGETAVSADEVLETAAPTGEVVETASSTDELLDAATGDESMFASGSQAFGTVSGAQIAAFTPADDGPVDDGAPEGTFFAEGSASVTSDALDVESMVGAMASPSDDDDAIEGEQPSDALTAEARDASDDDVSEPIEPE